MSKRSLASAAFKDDPKPKHQKRAIDEMDHAMVDLSDDGSCTTLDFNAQIPIEYSIASKIKEEDNRIELWKHLIKLEEEESRIRSVEEKKTFALKSRINLVLGYFNRFLNGLEETLGEDYKYEIGKKIWHAERIGQGGFGMVLKLIERNEHNRNELKSIRAVKVIPNSTIGLSEAIKATRLNCSGVVKVYNVMLIRYISCIEMEYIECGSLGDLIRNQSLHSKLTPIIVEKMLFQCCEVLSLMKQHEMVHSDIKPDNIMIRNFDNFDIAIADFGLALQNETIVKQLKGGTVTYLAPELVRNEEFKPTFQSDIYALGKTFSRLLKSVNLELSKDYCTDMMSDNPETRELAFYDFVRNEIKSYKKNVSSVWVNDFILVSSYLDECSHNVKRMEQVYGFTIGELLRKNKQFIMKYGLYRHAITYLPMLSHLNDKRLTSDREFMLGGAIGRIYEFSVSKSSRSVCSGFIKKSSRLPDSPFALFRIHPLSAHLCFLSFCL